MEAKTNQPLPWQITPFDGESISHYLGRVRRADAVSASSISGLSRALGLGIALARWEKFRFNPYPSQIELQALGQLVGLSVDCLLAMLPPEDEPIKLQPIRFCPACYMEAPYHRMKWQYQSTAGCDRHQLKLFCKCPSCGTHIQIPSLWAEPKCHHCGMPFKRMVKHQKSLMTASRSE
jgi:DNA-directed RNA polymerase subunit RPC12/RpoP